MQPDNFQPLPWSIKYIAGILVGVELLIQASEFGLFGGDSLRGGAMIYGALWPGIIKDGWIPLYPGQGGTMLLTHAFLHGSLIHMAMNTVIILGIGKRLGGVLSEIQLLLVFGMSAVAGGIVYLLFSTGDIPVIGASGAAFGFFGVWKYFEFIARKRMGLSLGPVWQFIGAMVLLNVALWYLAGGMLAWQAHLGGFAAGWALGIIFTRRGGQTRKGPRR